MPFNANLGSTSLTGKQVVDNGHPPIIDSLVLKANNGTLEKGQVMARDSSGEGVAHSVALASDVGDGDGAVDQFTLALTGYPVMPGSISISDGSQVVTDDGNGNLIGAGSGYINYATGAGTVKFANPPANLAEIEATYANDPVGVLNEKVDTTKATVGLTLKHGLYVKENCLVDSAAPAAATVARLKEKLIYPV